MHTWVDSKVHFLNKNISVGRKNRYVFENDIVWSNYFGTTSHTLHQFFGTLIFLILGNHNSFISVIWEVSQNFIHFIYKSCVSSKVLHLFVRYNNSTDGFGEVDK